MADSKGVALWVLAAGLAVAGLVAAGPAFAAHPLQTEDTGTQGAGNVELENGLSWSKGGDSKVFTYQPQISYGLSPALDLIVQPSWLTSRSGGSTVRGWGDTNLDAKWRFYGEAPVSFAVRAGATVATSQSGLGLPHGKANAHVLLVTTYDAAPFTLHGNVGLAQNPGGIGERRRIGSLSAALMWAANERLTLTVDGSAASNPDPASNSWPGTLLAGAIYTIQPGLDADVGYQSSLRAATPTRQWLVGLTYRFAP